MPSETFPEKIKTNNCNVTWWNEMFNKQTGSNLRLEVKQKIRILPNRVKYSSDWKTFNKELGEYGKEIRRSKRNF